MRNPLKSKSPKEMASDAYHNEYMRIAGYLNRKDRRTAQGQLVVANAKIAALQAENEVLRQMLPDGD